MSRVSSYGLALCLVALEGYGQLVPLLILWCVAVVDGNAE